MKLVTTEIKKLIKFLGFIPENGKNDIFSKKYENHQDYLITIDFNNEKIVYRKPELEETLGIRWGDATTSNFANSENFVVLECVDRLLEKGYRPGDIYLEFKFPLGRDEKGKLDILVFQEDSQAYLMIECKTWGAEFHKEQKKMQKYGGQLFSYYVQDKATQYLSLYTSKFENNVVEYQNDIITVDSQWRELNNQKEIFGHWNKYVKDNGIFDEWASAYGVEIKSLVRSRLQPLSSEDSGQIFNQFAEILRHNVVSDKPNAFNKILNLFICKIIDEDKEPEEQVEFQWLEDDTAESLQTRLNDLYREGMQRFLGIEVTDYSETEITESLTLFENNNQKQRIKEMFQKLRLEKNPEFAFIEVYDDVSFQRNARVVREVVELLQPFQFRYGHKQQFLGDFFELLLNTSIKQEAGQYFTPVPIARYIIFSLPIKEFMERKIKEKNQDFIPVAIDYACGTGHFLTEYMDRVQTILETEIQQNSSNTTTQRNLRNWSGDDGAFTWAEKFVYGIDADYRLVKATKVSSFLNGDGEANIIRANGLDHFIKSKDFKGKLKETARDDEKDNGQFDILIANPPYSVSSFKSTVQFGEESFELYQRFTDASSEIECLFVERMKQLLRVGGCAGIILPSSILSNTAVYTATREILLKYFKIIAITEFGSNTFMATGTNTVALFLERRANSDHEQIENAINTFFTNYKDVTVLGIEKAFSTYISYVFEGISYSDYLSFLMKEPNENFTKLEIYQDYQNWFHSLTEVENLKKKKAFKVLSPEEQEKKVNQLFYEKVFAIEKDKMLYFLLVYPQKTVVTKVGEKQQEKEFLGYEFSNRRGSEGIKMSPSGTKLYDENNLMNPEKANSYVLNGFLNENQPISEKLNNNINRTDLKHLIDFSSHIFEKYLHLAPKVQFTPFSAYDLVRLDTVCNILNGGTPKTNNPSFWDGDLCWASLVDTKDKYLYDTKRKITSEGLKSSNAVLLPVDTVIFSSRATIGEITIAKVPTCTNQGYKNFICNQELILPEYLYYILRESVEQISLLANGMTYKEISKELISAFKIPLPPLEIQEKIISEINNIEDKEEKDINKLIKLKEDCLKSDFFNYETERLGKIHIIAKRGKSSKYGNSSIQIIKSGQARGYMEFDFTTKHYVADSFVSDERNLQKGDILINSSGVGTAGRVTLFELDGDFVVDSHVTILRLNPEKAVPKYVLYALANIGFKTIEDMATGQSGQIELSINKIEGIRIPLPDLLTQKKIVKEIEVIEKKIQKLEKENTEIEEQKKQVIDKYLL